MASSSVLGADDILPRMKKDCPHCEKSMEGKFLHWRKFAKQDHFRACPLCGKSLQFQMYPDEIGVRVLGIALVIGGLYWAKERGGGYLAVFVTVALMIAIAWYAVSWRLRDKQRFRKPD